jgi:hypothetical protein
MVEAGGTSPLHASPSVVGRVADEAGVGRLIVSHIGQFDLDPAIAELRKFYAGPLTLGVSLRSAPCDDVCVAAVYGLDSGPGHHGDHRRRADVQRNGSWEREAETVLLRLIPNAGDRQSRSARRTAYLIGEKSVGLMNIRSTFVTSRPSRCDSSTTVFHSGSSLNTFQDLSASSRFGCARI